MLARVAFLPLFLSTSRPVMCESGLQVEGNVFKFVIQDICVHKKMTSPPLSPRAPH